MRRPPTTIVDLLRRPAEESPGDPCLRLRHTGNGDRVHTWGELWSGACGVAASLREAGVRPGDRVMLVLPTGRGFVDSFFGVAIAGGVPVPAAPPARLRAGAVKPHLESLAALASDCSAAACIAARQVVAVIGEALSTAVPGLRPLAVEGLVEGTDPAAPTAAINDLALLQYTSGSTSSPKGVELTHANLLANLESIRLRLDHPQPVVVSWLPLYHDMGLIGILLTALYGRARLTLMPASAFVRDPACWLRALSDDGGTVSAAPNFAFQYCAEQVDLEELGGVRLDKVRHILNGAEPVDREAVERFEWLLEPLGLRRHLVRPVYGLAESAVAVTFSESGPLRVDAVDARRLERDDVALPASAVGRQRQLVSVGKPVPGQRVRIVDNAGRALPERVVGEITVSGAAVMRGYHGRPEETRRTLRGGWLHTGDLGYLADGDLFVTGRSKDLIILRGRNFYPEDLESLARRAAGGKLVTVVAFGGGESSSGELGSSGQQVVLVVEARGGRRDDLDALERRLRAALHDAFLFAPDVVLLVRPGSVPRTTSGKVRRQECRRRFITGRLGDRRQGRADVVGAGTEGGLR